MGSKSLVATAALAAAVVAAPAASQEPYRVPTMATFFVAFALDARNAKEALPNFGLQLQGEKAYQNLKVDYQTFRMLPAALTSIGATVAATKKDSPACREVCAK